MRYLKTYESFNIGSPLLKLSDNVDYDLVDVIKSSAPIGSQILEISCGNAADAKYLSKIGYKVTCTETNDGYIENAKSLGLNCMNHDTKDKFPFKDKQFSLIYSRLGLHYFTAEELDLILQELSRIGNKLLITVKLVNDIQTNKIILTEDIWKDIISKHFNIEEFEVKEGILYDVQSKWLEILSGSK